MTFRMALKFIRRHAPETEGTFRHICRNRYCHPVRQWAIHDLAQHENLSFESAERRYYRHLRRLHEIFGVSQVGYLWRGARSRSSSAAMHPSFKQPRKGEQE